MSSGDFSQFIAQRAKALDLNVTELTKQAGISRATWYRFLHSEIEEAKLSTLIRLADVLQVTPLRLLRTYFRGKELRQKFDSGFLEDVTYPDNSLVQVGEAFDKTWAVENTGIHAWVGWYLQCADAFVDLSVALTTTREPLKLQYGLRPHTMRIPIPVVQPNEQVQLTVRFTAPIVPGTYISYWKTVDEQGEWVFPEKIGLNCTVKVVSV